MEEIKHIGFRIILLNYYIKCLRGEKIEKYVLQERTFLTCFILRNVLQWFRRTGEAICFFFIFYCVEREISLNNLMKEFEAICLILTDETNGICEAR